MLYLQVSQDGISYSTPSIVNSLGDTTTISSDGGE
jgi:hypothetical protein